MKIDIDSIRNTNNLSLLSSYLDNFIYSNITEDDIQAVPEGNIVKLIKILQFSNEYLLGVRQNLDENIINIKPVIQHSIERKRPVFTLPKDKKRPLSEKKSFKIIHKYYDENFILEDDDEENTIK